MTSTKIVYEKYSELYYVYLREGVGTQLTFDELQELGIKIQEVVSDELSAQLALDLGDGGANCDGGGCII